MRHELHIPSALPKLTHLPAARAWLAVIFALSCSRQEPPAAGTTPPEAAAHHHSPPAAAEPSAEEPEPLEVPVSATTSLLAEVGFQTPESVLYDPLEDVYLVSNVNGDPLAKDENGFISRVSPDGEVQARFIESGKNKVTLHAPKGMAVLHDTLVVADIDVLRLFHRKTGAPQGTLAISGSTFLNGVAAAPDGKTIYVSDSGLTTGLKPSGTDAVYRVVDGKVDKFASGDELGRPNGLLPEAGGTWVVSFGSGELYWLTHRGKRERVRKLDQGALDGIVKTDDGRLLISSWEASAVFVGKPEGPFTKLLGGVQSPADLGYDRKRQRLLVPLFERDAIVFHSLQESE